MHSNKQNVASYYAGWRRNLKYKLQVDAWRSAQLPKANASMTVKFYGTRRHVYTFLSWISHFNKWATTSVRMHVCMVQRCARVLHAQLNIACNACWNYKHTIIVQSYTKSCINGIYFLQPWEQCQHWYQPCQQSGHKLKEERCCLQFHQPN